MEEVVSLEMYLVFNTMLWVWLMDVVGHHR